MLARRFDPSATTALLVSASLAALSAALFMTLGAKGSWSFILAFRGQKLATLLIVAYAIAVSTVLFQTVTGNRILTPSIMGFDALHGLAQTCLVFFLGSSGLSGLDPRLVFTAQAAIMMLFCISLFRSLFSGAIRSLHLLLLVGILIGGLFRSLSSFLQRVIDPNEFLVLQDRLFASFNSVDGTLIGISAAIVALVSIIITANLRRFDVLLLGREMAIGLGIEHKKLVTLAMSLIAVLVSVSTALVGPVTFFGLLVANLAYLLVPDHRHSRVLPVAVFIAAIVLVGGQLILERLFAFSTALSIVIEFFGGMVFMLMLMRGRRQ
jgi:iron complex transport system permease protein